MRDELIAALAEDPANTGRLLDRLDALAAQSGIGSHSALLGALTHLWLDEGDARRHRDAIRSHRAEPSDRLGREVVLRVVVSVEAPC